MHVPNVLGYVLRSSVLTRAPLWLAVLACGAVIGTTVRIEHDVSGALIALLMLSSALVGILQQTLP